METKKSDGYGDFYTKKEPFGELGTQRTFTFINILCGKPDFSNL